MSFYDTQISHTSQHKRAQLFFGKI